MATFLDVPKEVLHAVVFPHLAFEDLLRCSVVNLRLRQLVITFDGWQQLADNVVAQTGHEVFADFEDFWGAHIKATAEEKTGYIFSLLQSYRTSNVEAYTLGKTSSTRGRYFGEWTRESLSTPPSSSDSDSGSSETESAFAVPVVEKPHQSFFMRITSLFTSKPQVPKVPEDQVQRVGSDTAVATSAGKPQAPESSSVTDSVPPLDKVDDPPKKKEPPSHEGKWARLNTGLIRTRKLGIWYYGDKNALFKTKEEDTHLSSCLVQCRGVIYGHKDSGTYSAIQQIVVSLKRGGDPNRKEGKTKKKLKVTLESEINGGYPYMHAITVHSTDAHRTMVLCQLEKPDCKWYPEYFEQKVDIIVHTIDTHRFKKYEEITKKTWRKDTKKKRFPRIVKVYDEFHAPLWCCQQAFVKLVVIAQGGDAETLEQMDNLLGFRKMGHCMFYMLCTPAAFMLSPKGVVASIPTGKTFDSVWNQLM